MGRYAAMLTMLLLALLLSTKAGAQDWTVFFDDGDAKYYVNAPTIEVLPENKVRAWQKKERIGGPESLSLVEVDCAAKMVRTVQLDSGKPVPDMPSAWRYIEPTEFEIARFRAWCMKTLPREVDE